MSSRSCSAASRGGARRSASGWSRRSAPRGPGFELAAAWGAVAIPGEARIPNVALELADVRMYAQKDSQRGAGSSLSAEAERIEVAGEASAASPSRRTPSGRRLDREALEQRQQ